MDNSNCSGKFDCQCNDCNDSDSEDKSSISPKILDKLPAGAIPISQYRAAGRHRAAPPLAPLRHCNPPADQPLTILVPVFPLNNLVGLESGVEGRISISILNNNGTVTLAWETFRGQLGSRGIGSVSLSTSLPYLPKYSITAPILVDYNGLGQFGKIVINPKEAIDVVKFYFNQTGTNNTLFGDIVQIYGNSLTFISSPC